MRTSSQCTYLNMQPTGTTWQSIAIKTPERVLGAQLCMVHVEMFTSWSARTRKTHLRRTVSLSITDTCRRRAEVVRMYEKGL